MPVTVDSTPNPNAMKFTVGLPVGGPATFVDAAEAEDPVVASLLEIDGVNSIFVTADFFTVTKTAEGDWGIITPEATGILTARYS